MADEFNPGAAPDPVQQVKDAALSEVAKSEDITNSVAERQDRDAEARGEEVDTEARAERIREALSKARQDTAEARAQNGLDQPPLDLDSAFQTAEQEWSQAEAEETTFEAEREAAKAEGRFTAVAEDLKRANPQAWQTITDHMAAIDTMLAPEQVDAMKRAITRGDPRESLAVLHRFTQASGEMTPEAKLQYLASLSPEQLAQTIDQGRTYLRMEHDLSRQIEARYAAQGRRHSNAPPPIKPVKGGAGPPRSLEALASKENPTDYIRARQAQMKKDRE